MDKSFFTRLLPSLVILAHAPAAAQEVTVLTEDLCTSCSIEIIPDVVLGTDGESVIGPALDIERLSDGRYAIAFDDVTYEFTVFSADGSEFRRVGRAGEGPGEYGHVWFVREHDGRLHVFDRVRNRITELDRDYDVVGTERAVCMSCSPGDMAMLPDGSAVLNFMFPVGGFERYGTLEELRAAGSWTLIHIMGEDGRPQLSMDEIPGGTPGLPFRHLALAPDGSLLSARLLMEYRIDRWDPATGEHLVTLVRAADWWPEDNPASPPAPDARPPTTMKAMHVDAAGRLWVYISRPTPDWRDHVESTGLPEYMGGEWRYGPGATEWVVEVVDLDAGRVIVSQVLDVEPHPRARFFAPGWLAVYDEEQIVPLYRMYRVRLEGAGQPRRDASTVDRSARPLPL